MKQFFQLSASRVNYRRVLRRYRGRSSWSEIGRADGNRLHVLETGNVSRNWQSVSARYYVQKIKKKGEGKGIEPVSWKLFDQACIRRSRKVRGDRRRWRWRRDGQTCNSPSRGSLGERWEGKKGDRVDVSLKIGRASTRDRGDRSSWLERCLESKHVRVLRRMDENRYLDIPSRKKRTSSSADRTRVLHKNWSLGRVSSRSWRSSILFLLIKATCHSVFCFRPPGHLDAIYFIYLRPRRSGSSMRFISFIYNRWEFCTVMEKMEEIWYSNEASKFGDIFSELKCRVEIEHLRYLFLWFNSNYACDFRKKWVESLRSDVIFFKICYKFSLILLCIQRGLTS